MILIQESLKSAHRLTSDLKSLFTHSPHMMWVVDPATLKLKSANQAAAAAHGYSLEEFEKLRLHDLVDPAIIPQILHEIKSTPSSTIASPHLRKDGTQFFIDIEAREIVIGGQNHRLVMGVDVTAREALLKRLTYEASHDHLTGLYSRKGLLALENDFLEASQKKGKGVALACISLRHFKAVNDTYGDHTGDQCLKAIAQRIETYVRPCDIAGRTAGDHFEVLFGEISDTAEAERLSTWLLASLVEPIVIGDISIRMRVSIGLATAPEDGDDVAKLRSRAQTAMWEASKLGISEVCRFLPGYAADEAKDLRIVAAMEEMLKNGTFEVHYQPICQPDGHICGLEALLRMNPPKLGNISPSVFVPVAEESGLILPLGQWVLEHVCMQINEWKRQGIPLVPVAVNISGLQFRQSDFSSRILGTLNSFNIPSRLLHLELTESTVLQNIPDALEEMQRLSANGLRFSIDDFGTGYSSLGRLQEMPISTLKIDRSFIQGITHENSTMVASIISLAHALGMKVIAEGVEEEEQLDVLSRLNCDFMQGFLFSKPLPPRILEPLMSSGSCLTSTDSTDENLIQIGPSVESMTVPPNA
nr:EAL domain-containing protein [Granulicella sp. dw_53]